MERSGKRPHFSYVDRCVWILLATVWSRWHEALVIVHADTVRRWKRQGVRRHLVWQHRRKRPGRPAMAAETRALIRRVTVCFSRSIQMHDLVIGLFVKRCEFGLPV